MKKTIFLLMALSLSILGLANNSAKAIKSIEKEKRFIPLCREVITNNVTCCPMNDPENVGPFTITLNVVTRFKDCATGKVLFVTVDDYANGCPPGTFQM